MLNHNPSVVPIVYKKETGRHERLSNARLGVGDEILNNYGSDTAVDSFFKLLHSYGFTTTLPIHLWESIRATLPCTRCTYMHSISTGLQKLDPTHVQFESFVPAASLESGGALTSATAQALHVRFAIHGGHGSTPRATVALMRAYVRSHPEVVAEFAGGTFLQPSFPALQATMRSSDVHAPGDAVGASEAAETDRLAAAVMLMAVQGRMQGFTGCHCKGAEGVWAEVASGAQAGRMQGAGVCPMQRPVLAFNAMRCTMLCRNEHDLLALLTPPSLAAVPNENANKSGSCRNAPPQHTCNS